MEVRSLRFAAATPAKLAGIGKKPRMK